MVVVVDVVVSTNQVVGSVDNVVVVIVVGAANAGAKSASSSSIWYEICSSIYFLQHLTSPNLQDLPKEKSIS